MSKTHANKPTHPNRSSGCVKPWGCHLFPPACYAAFSVQPFFFFGCANGRMCTCLICCVCRPVFDVCMFVLWCHIASSANPSLSPSQSFKTSHASRVCISRKKNVCLSRCGTLNVAVSALVLRSVEMRLLITSALRNRCYWTIICKNLSRYHMGDANHFWSLIGQEYPASGYTTRNSKKWILIVA